MKEHFIISYPNSYSFPNLLNAVISLVVSILIIYKSPLGFDSIVSYISCGILFLIFFVIIKSITSENLSNELPSTLYPSLPHTGLDGISLNSYVAGLDVNQYVV